MRTLPLHALGITFAAALTSVSASPIPSFTNASVHDPSVVEADGAYYVFGSHLASAWSPDLMNWYQVSSSVADGNPLFPNVTTDLAAVLAYSSTDTLWAPDVHRMPDGTFDFFYCACEGSSPLSSLGHARSGKILGPYEDEGVLLQSGMRGTSPDGTLYNATRHPNAVDPTLFNSPDGRLFMVYGSYSGGIFVLEMNPTTGDLLPNQGYGTKIMGGNHVRIEGAYTTYNAETGYYYTFVSYGGLASDGGYNIRVCRATSPKGPYCDAAGQDMIKAIGPSGSFFDDAAIAPYGVKLMGNWQFQHHSGEHYSTSTGYLSPGHNSILHDPNTGKWFNVFHTRFVGRDEAHEIRVHQMFFNADGWPVVMPHRYAGETIGQYNTTSLAGTYKVINHGKDISTTVKTSTEWTFNADGSITGVGSWALNANGQDMTISTNGTTYKGVFCRTWDEDNRIWVNSFSALANSGITIWGSAVGVPNRSAPYTSPDFANVGAKALRPGETLQLSLSDRQEKTPYVFEFELLNAPEGASVDKLTGKVSYAASLSDSGQDHTINVRAYDVYDSSLNVTTSFPVHVGSPLVYASDENTFASAASTGVRDSAGVRTGLTARLSGTSNPSNDSLLTMNTSSAALTIKTSRSDLNGQAGVALMSAPGRHLSEFGFTGSEDFVVTAKFGAFSGLGTADQVGLYVGNSTTKVTRAGVIYLGSNQVYSVHTNGTSDTGGHFTTTIDLSEGMTVSIARQQGVWQYTVNGISTHPLSGEAAFLNSLSDLTVGVFAITPLNSVQKSAPLKSLSVQVSGGASTDTPIAQWLSSTLGSGATIAGDPDGDGLSNLLEYAIGSNPQQSAAMGSINVWTQNGATTVRFTRVADPALRYCIESAASASSTTWTPLWTSEGSDNTAGTVEVTLPYSGPKQLRLRVETVDSNDDPGALNVKTLIDAGVASWASKDPSAVMAGDCIWTKGFGWVYTGFWPWAYQWNGTGWMYIYGPDTEYTWAYLYQVGSVNWTSGTYWPWVWNEAEGWRKLTF